MPLLRHMNVLLILTDIGITVAHMGNRSKKAITTHFWLWYYNLLNNKCQIIKYYTHSYETGGESFHLLCQEHKANFPGLTCMATVKPTCGEANAVAFNYTHLQFYLNSL